MGQSTRHTTFEFVAAQPWAIQPHMLETIAAIARRENESPEAVAAKLGRPLQNTRTVSLRDGVAVVPVTGPIMRYANLFTEISGATSLEVLARDFSAALNNNAVKAVVLDMDSPGGQAAGISEFAQMVRAANKPVVAYVGDMAASAAYWIASAADEIVISKTGMVGCIGAVVAIDTRQQAGVLEIVSSQSPKKRPNIATDEGRAQIQRNIDALAQVFVDDVAKYRGVSPKQVLSDFGQGDVMMGAAAVTIGMADRVSTLESVIGQLNGKTKTEDQPMHKNTPATAPAAASFEALVKQKTEAGLDRSKAIRAVVASHPDVHAEYIYRSNNGGDTPATAPAAASFEALVKQKTEAGLDRSKAIRAVVASHPDVHAEYIYRGNNGGQ